MGKGDYCMRGMKNSSLQLLAVLIFLLIAAIALAKHNKVTKTNSESNKSSIIQLGTAEVKQLIGEMGDRLYLLDVRELNEYKEGHILGTTLISLGELESKLAELNPQQPILVICRSGNRSNIAAQLLIKNGFKQVYNYQGGMLSWDGNLVVE